MTDMLHDEKKIAKIVEELTIFFFGIGGNDISSNIKKVENQAIISFRSNYSDNCAHKLEGMEKSLQKQKNEGIEDIYWELAGSGDPGETSQLLLIGMMVDEAKVTIEGGYVTIELKKNMYI